MLGHVIEQDWIGLFSKFGFYEHPTLFKGVILK